MTGMEGTELIPGVRAAQYEQAHPEYDIHPAPGGRHWFAWKQAGDRVSGELTHADTEAELLAKLGG